MSNQQLQLDEVEALAAIYGSDWITEDFDNRVFSIVVKPEGATDSNNDTSIAVQIRFPLDYPLEAPPLYTLSAPWMKKVEKIKLMNELEEMYCQNAGQSIVYMWIEKIREHLANDKTTHDSTPSEDESPSTDDAFDVEKYNFRNKQHRHSVDEEPIIFHGEPVIDRRSTFQAHVAPVDCVDRAKQLIEVLKSNKKLSTATHNITAYRISGGPHNTCIQDCDDDGEAHAGARLLHLLQILDVRDVMVMVSRWYGGIQLGPDRFKHINNVARELLEKSGFLELNNQTESNAAQKKKKK